MLQALGVAGDNQLLTAADATTLVSTMLGFIKDNIVFVLPLVGFAVGFAIFRKMANKATKGRI